MTLIVLPLALSPFHAAVPVPATAEEAVMWLLSKSMFLTAALIWIPVLMDVILLPTNLACGVCQSIPIEPPLMLFPSIRGGCVAVLSWDLIPMAFMDSNFRMLFEMIIWPSCVKPVTAPTLIATVNEPCKLLEDAISLSVPLLKKMPRCCIPVMLLPVIRQSRLATVVAPGTRGCSVRPIFDAPI